MSRDWASRALLLSPLDWDELQETSQHRRKDCGSNLDWFWLSASKKHFFLLHLFFFYRSLLWGVSKKLKTFIPSPFSKTGQIKKTGLFCSCQNISHTFSLLCNGTKRVKKDFFPEFFCKVKQNEHFLFEPTQFSFCAEFFFEAGKALQKAVM